MVDPGGGVWGPARPPPPFGMLEMAILETQLSSFQKCMGKHAPRPTLKVRAFGTHCALPLPFESHGSAPDQRFIFSIVMFVQLLLLFLSK